MKIWSTTAHPADGEWRAYLDGEVSDGHHEALERHLERCIHCRTRLMEIQETAGFAAARLGALRAVADIAPVPSMPARIQPAAPDLATKEVSHMTRSRFFGRIATVAAAALVAVSLLIPGVRAAAADLIGVFRVKEAKVIRITPADLVQFEKSGPFSFAGISQKMLEGLIEFEDAPAMPLPQEEWITLEQLKERGFRAPTWVPPGYSFTSGAYFAPQEAKIRVNVDRVNELLSLIGSKERFPAEFKGQTITRTMGATMIAGYRDHQSGANLTLTRSEGFSFSATGGADVKKAMTVLLAIFAEQTDVPESIRSQLKGLDLTQTAPIAVVDGLNQEVQVRGNPGVFTPMQPGGGSLVWMENGVVYTINAFGGSTSLTVDDLLHVAESLAR